MFFGISDEKFFETSLQWRKFLPRCSVFAAFHFHEKGGGKKVEDERLKMKRERQLAQSLLREPEREISESGSDERESVG